MNNKKLLSIILTFIMLFSVSAVIGVLEVNAATLAKPVVTLTNKSTTSVNISWEKISGASKYVVYRSTKKSSGFKSIKTLTSTSYTNTSLTCGKAYYYKVKAIKGKNSSYSSVKGITAKPATVTVKMEKGCSYLTPSWTKSSGVSGYEVFYSSSKSGTYKKLATTTALSYKQSGLALGTTRYYKVRGYKTVGKSKVYGAYSTIVGAKTYTSHSIVSEEYESTCKTKGYTLNKCQRKGCTYSKKTDYKELSDHSYTWEKDNESKEENVAVGVCKFCGDKLKDTFGGVCYIDLDTMTVSQSYAAKVNKAGDKITLKGDGYTKYEITGNAKNVTIDVDVKDGTNPITGKANELELKLCGASINNIDKNCIDIKDKTTDANGKAIISIKTDTDNYLYSTTSGNAVDSSCALEIKGHGKLNINTASTSIDCRGKIDIKNATLNITSGNRGIDTKKEIADESGDIVDTEFSNITIGTNANITIYSIDDGIRCKNMEIEAKNPTAEPADVDSIIYIKSGSDGIQLEGKKGIEINSGKFTIIADKYAFNCSSDLIKNNAGISLSNCKGNKGLYKA